MVVKSTDFPFTVAFSSVTRKQRERKKKMSWSSNNSRRRVSNFSDLIQRVTASCLLHPLANQSEPATCYHSQEEEQDEEVTAEEESESDQSYESETNNNNNVEDSEVPLLTWQVFDAVSDMKRAYAALQAAHNPWDPDRIRAADAAVVSQLRRLGALRDKFRRTTTRGIQNHGSRGSRNKVTAGGGSKMKEVVAPYEAAVEELKRELKAKQAEIDNLMVKQVTREGRKGRSVHHSKKKMAIYCSTATHVSGSPVPELFKSTMSSVIKASKSFTGVMLSLMRSANWDLAAAAKSIQVATISATTADPTGIPTLGPHHAKYAMESYISHKIFQGFDHETFYMDGSLSSLIEPHQFRRNCFAQYHDMQGMDPTELLGILPNCPFGNFCSKKYLEILHTKMEESLFGDLEQRRHVVGGTHPRTQFYDQFLALAKAVWLLHLLAFSLDPSPTRFEAPRGAEFQPQLMDNVGLSSAVGPQLVGFPLTPGFKLGNGFVIKARVCVVPKAS